jgi:hypothetical protein
MMIGSSPVSTTTSDITIDRLACEFNIPDGLENPASVADQLERIARHEIARACADAFAPLDDDAAVYRIRHIHLNLWIDTQAMTEADIAQRWGELLAQAITQAIRQGGAQQVMRFESPRQFVTAFLRDLLAGRAWSRWYCDEFRPLQRLPAQAVALQMCIARPDWIAPLLADLGDTLIERWTQADIAQLWDALNLPVERARRASPDLLAELLALRPVSSGTTADARARDALRLWLALDRPQAARDPRYIALIHTLIDVLALLRTEPELSPLLAMRSPLYPALIRRIAASPLADVVEWLTAADPDLLAQMAALPVESAALVSPVGGVFLLLPALVEMGIWERWRADADDLTARRWLFAVALKALGHDRAPMLLGDALLAAFAGLDAPPLADARLPLEPDRPPGAWARSLPDIAARWYPTHTRDLVAGESGGLLILRDAAAGHWLEAVETAQQDFEKRHDPSDAAAGHWLAVGDWGNLGATRPPTLDEQTALDTEAAYFRLGQRLGYPWLTPSLDAALSAVTSLALRRTASRLPGFARSSAIYTARQFLATPAEFDPDALALRLNGGPLGVVLSLAGLPWTVHAPWLEGPLALLVAGDD